MEQRITFLTLAVQDLSTSADFYENTFGWQRSPMSTEHMVVFQLNGGILLSLYSREELAKDANQLPDGNGFKGFTLSHNLGSEHEVDLLFTQLKAKNVQVIKEPQKVFWGGYSGYVADPDGNLWEIAYNPFM